jgi:hypothetical protein
MKIKIPSQKQNKIELKQKRDERNRTTEKEEKIVKIKVRTHHEREEGGESRNRKWTLSST